MVKKREKKLESMIRIRRVGKLKIRVRNDDRGLRWKYSEQNDDDDDDDRNDDVASEASHSYDT